MQNATTCQKLSLKQCSDLYQDERTGLLCRLIEQDLHHGLSLLPSFSVTYLSMQNEVGEKIAQYPTTELKKCLEFFKNNIDSGFVTAPAEKLFVEDSDFYQSHANNFPRLDKKFKLIANMKLSQAQSRENAMLQERLHALELLIRDGKSG